MLTRKIQGDTMLFYEGDRLVLTIDEPEADGRVFMILKGDLTMETANHIQDELDAFTTACVPVTMDFGGVDYCSVSALEGLVKSQTLIDSLETGDLILRNIPDNVYQVMDQLNIVDLFYIDDEGDK